MVGEGETQVKIRKKPILKLVKKIKNIFLLKTGFEPVLTSFKLDPNCIYKKTGFY